MERHDHSSYVLQQLNNQREWGFLCDCCIAIDDIYFQAHKAVLAACSSYFKMFFMNHQDTTGPLKLSNMKINAECFDLILQFMYLGKIMTSPTNVEKFKVAINYLQLYNIKECLESIQDSDVSTSKRSTFYSGSHENKMVFGVKMYEDLLIKNGEGTKMPSPGASTPIHLLQAMQTKKEMLQASTGGESPIEVCRKSTIHKLTHSKDRATRRFGRSYTCDSCGFVFSCEKLLGEHVISCANRHSFQKAKSYSSQDNNVSCAKISTHQTESFKVEANVCLENASYDLSSLGSTKKSVDISDQLEGVDSNSSERNEIIIKIEAEENPAVEMEDINIIKISDKYFIESSENDDQDDETDEPLCSFYVEENIDGNPNADHILKTKQSINLHDRKTICPKNKQFCNSAKNMCLDATESKVCELCELIITEEDISAHYLSKHIENICACGKCGQILVKGRQLQEHAERCGETIDPSMNAVKNEDENFDYGETVDERTDMMFVEMMDDMRDANLQQNNLTVKYSYEPSVCTFRCLNCGQRFETESLVVDHMSHCFEHGLFKNTIMEENDNDHKRKHFCNLCGKGFYQRCHLREHFTVHTKKKQFVCQTCGKQFLRERQLRLHNDMHKGMARYVCSVCDQGNFRKHDHVRHMICHLSMGETMCQVCFQIFPANDLLEQHMDVHLYTCGVCGAKFSLRKDMRSHYNLKHFKRT